MSTINIVFDIDGVLNTHNYGSVNNETRLFFQKKSVIFNIKVEDKQYEHYVTPGAVELMQLLFSLPDVNVHFFSAGAKGRNDQFVEALLIKALGEERYSQLKSTIKIGSRGDVDKKENLYGEALKEEEQRSKARYQKYNLEFNQNKKNLLKLLDENDLDNAILIDDDAGVISYGQEKCLLRSRWIQTDHYENDNLERAEAEKHPDRGPHSPYELQVVDGIYYIAGVLMTCIENRDKQLVTETLFPLHYKQNPKDPENFVTCFQDTLHEEVYYEKGLAALRTINPNLTFTTLETFNATIKPNPPAVSSMSFFRQSPTASVNENDETVLERMGIEIINTLFSNFRF